MIIKNILIFMLVIIGSLAVCQEYKTPVNALDPYYRELLRIPFVRARTSYDSVLMVHTGMTMQEYVYKLMDKTYEQSQQMNTQLSPEMIKSNLVLYYCFDKDLPLVLINGLHPTDPKFYRYVNATNHKIVAVEWDPKNRYGAPLLRFKNGAFSFDLEEKGEDETGMTIYATRKRGKFAVLKISTDE